MRRLAVLVAAAAAFVALTAVAFAANNTVDYASKLTQKGRAADTPVNTSYRGTLNIKTTDNTQPDVAPTTTLFFPDQVINNAKLFDACSVKDIDGKATFPSKCNKAQIGAGTARAQAGQPGQPSTITENLTVRAVNGTRGRAILLVLKEAPGAPVAVNNRVVEGKLGRASGKFGYKVTFRVPPDLQEQLGLKISLSFFDVTISSRKTETKTIARGERAKVSYLQVEECPRSKTLPFRTVVNFANGQNITKDTTFSCR